MKKLFTLFAFLFVVMLTAQAQTIEERATILTQEIAKQTKLNDTEFLKVKKFTIERLTRIDALAELREQDERYLNLRLDQIDEEYNSKLFNTLSEKQYLAFMKYKAKQPYTYAAIAKQPTYIAASDEE